MSSIKKPASKIESKPQQPMLFDKENYILIIASLVILVIGFMLMSGTTDIYNSTKLTVAPIVVILGFILGIVAIFYRKKAS
jgi:FtsH-binding integral membrane protein